MYTMIVYSMHVYVYVAYRCMAVLNHTAVKLSSFILYGDPEPPSLTKPALELNIER